MSRSSVGQEPLMPISLLRYRISLHDAVSLYHLGFLILFAVLGASELFQSRTSLRAETWVLAAAVQGLILFFLVTSRELERAVWTVLGTAIGISFTLRAVVLATRPDSFSYSHLFNLTHSAMEPAYLFLLGSLGAMGVALRLVLRHRENRLWSSAAGTDSRPRTVWMDAVRQRFPLVAFVLCASLIVHYAGRELGEGGLGYLKRLVLDPTLSGGILLTVLLLFYARGLLVPHRRMLYGILALAVALVFVEGGRTFLVLWFLLLVSVAPLRREQLRIPLSWLVSLALLFLVIAPPALTAVMIVRDQVRSGIVTPDAAQLVIASFLDVVPAFDMLSARMAGLDTLVAAMGYQPPDIWRYYNTSNVFHSFLNALLLDGWTGGSTIALGRAWGYLYQGVPFDMPHSGAASGFGTLFLLFGWMGPVVGGVYMFAVGYVLRRSRRAGLFGLVVSGMALQTLVFTFVTSGNVDLLFGHFLTETVLVGAVAVALRVRLGPARVPASGSDEPAANP